MDNEKKYLVDEETALAEFIRFGEANYRDFNEARMSEDDLDNFLNIKRRVLKNIQDGHLVINEDGLPAYTPYASGDAMKSVVFRFRLLGAKDYTTMDRAKKGKDVTKFHHLIASATGKGLHQVEMLIGPDYKAVQDLMMLFLDE
jgi:hypothetical protein